MKRNIFLILAGIMLILACSVVPDERILLSSIEFKDEYLEACVKRTEKEYIDELTELVCSSESVKDLSGIENLVYLTKLDLSNNGLGRQRYNETSTTQLSSLINLTELNLSKNTIRNRDLVPLTNLTNLVELNLRSNAIYHVGPVTNLKKLKVLDLAFNHISTVDLTIVYLHNLTTLDLSYNRELTGDRFSIKALSGLKTLKKLHLRGTKFRSTRILERNLPDCEIYG